ncbi:hypothetical protein [Mycobacterium sp. IDR2000157661]|uniref:hypothetical protein n=1 Tax=Mycobacterium sp. IDR2000157661 TaxID=2867005 RepID=UPI001EEEE1A4|nr:hypothetical protein [Mycobacterium sp. IDR2000157661]ULE34933.1 hypothetical protein K3G64_10350 [Mycobacterium sp. IDR2000157661]
MAQSKAQKTDSGLAARVAALASAGAAVIHIAVTPTHWQEWVLSGIFFALLALFQFVWAWLVVTRPSTPVLGAGIVVNLGSVAVWALSRTAGVPFGPHAGEPELVRAAGICALLLQSYIVMGAAWVWVRGHRSRSVPRLGYGMVLAGAGTVIAVAVAVGVVSGLQHGHHSSGGEAEHGHHPPDGAEEGHHGVPAPPPAPRPAAPQDPAQEPAPAHDHDDHHDHG